MTVRQQWALVGLIVAVLGAGLFGAVHLFGSELNPVTVGSPAPDFRASVLGRPAVKTLADYTGRVVVLNIWATWCEPCKVEMPSLEALHRAFAAGGLEVVGVSIDDAVTDDSIRAYANDLGLTFQILHDPTHAIERAYQTTGYPETFVIGPDGIIRKKWIGPANWNSPSNRLVIAELLGLTAPRQVRDDAGAADSAQRPAPLR